MSSALRPEDDEVIDALDELSTTLEQAAAAEQEMADRAQSLRAKRAEGRSWSDIIAEEPRPRLVELLTITLGRLATASNQFRRLLAAQLRHDELSTEQIARLFGVTRQRISHLLRGERESARV